MYINLHLFKMDNKNNNKFNIQENEYVFPYHHLVHISRNNFSSSKSLMWGLEYFSYVYFIKNYLSQKKI